jgi:nucleoid-associated protein YgaU
MAKKGLFSAFRKKDDQDRKVEVDKQKAEPLIKQQASASEQKSDSFLKQQTSASEQKAAKKDVQKPVKKHVVVSGDTLSGIAKKYYDDAGKYMEIYKANKEVIGDNPDLIQPGMELIIPEL